MSESPVQDGTVAPGADRDDVLTACEARIGHTFRDRALLRAALTHASGAETRLASNERLEFLGDAILGATICERLFRDYPSYLEGDLTKVKSAVVSRQTCARVSRALGLQDFLIIGKGMASSPELPSSLLSDVFEAVVAAIHLDGGAEASRAFIDRNLAEEIEAAVAGDSEENYKSKLQQLAQREFGTTPAYRLLDEKGPDHAKCFQIAAHVGARTYTPAWGNSKKQAEQRAARNALEELRSDFAPAD